MSIKNSVVADTIHGNIIITDLEKKVMSHTIFNRMHDVYQNSTVFLTFPCNRTKRFEHSLGTMKLCSDMFYSSIQNAEQEIRNDFLLYYQTALIDILKNIKREKYAEYSNKFGGRVKKIPEDVMPIIEESSLTFQKCIRGIDAYDSTYFVLLQAVRIAALLHDIGHPPYSHITEFALDNVGEKVKILEDNERIQEFKQIMDDFFGDNGKKLHEQMGDKIVDIIMSDSIDDINEYTANNSNKIFSRQIFEVLVKETVERILKNRKPFDALHMIIDGTLDGDRLDYVTRDALNSGLNKGKIEYDRLCNSMIVTKKESDFWFCTNIKSLNTVEDYLNRRWDIYKNIIFHHRVIKTDYLLQNIIQELSVAYLKNEIDGEKLDNSSDLLPADISGLWKALKTSTNVDSAYAISQWDDAWLMTVLKKHYFKDYINREGSPTKLTKQLSELLTNKKYYFSVIKRLEDFLLVDKAIANGLNYYYEKISEKINLLKALSKVYNDKNKGDLKEYTVTIDPFINDIEKIFTLSKAVTEKLTFQGLIFSYLRKIHSATFGDCEDINGILNNIIQEAIKYFPDNSIEDIFCVVKKYDIGLKKPLLLYDNRHKKIVSIHEVSSIAKILDLSYDTFPQFFIYILKTDAYKNTDLRLNDFLIAVGNAIAEKYCIQWLQIIDNKINAYNLTKQ